MNKIVPIISIIFSALTLAIGICGIILICVALSVPPVAILAVPIVLVGAGLSVIFVALNAFFTKSLLCKIALGVAACALSVCLASIIIWLCIL